MTHSATPGHRPGRAGHKILRRLATDRAPIADLIQAADVDPFTARGRKLPHLISSMVRDGFIAAGSGRYWITDEGRWVLAMLDDGQAVIVGAAPSVRIFGRAA